VIEESEMPMTDTKREERIHNLKGCITLLREARSHAMGAQSKRSSPFLGKIVNELGVLEGEAMMELHKMVRADDG